MEDVGDFSLQNNRLDLYPFYLSVPGPHYETNDSVNAANQLNLKWQLEFRFPRSKTFLCSFVFSEPEQFT